MTNHFFNRPFSNMNVDQPIVSVFVNDDPLP